MIVNPVMYGGGSAEMKTITIISTTAAVFGYYDEGGNFMTVSANMVKPVSITVPVGTVLASATRVSIDGLSVQTITSNKCYLYRVEP